MTFEEAETVWNDEHRVDANDEAHSQHEERRFTIGLSNRLRLLAVAYTERNETIRIISARRATKTETRRYTDQG